VEKPVSAMSSLERWSVFIKYYTDEGRQGLLERILREEEAIAMAAQVVQGFTQSELEFFRKMSLHKMETAYWDEIAYAEERGETRGLAQGRAESRRQILELLSQGISVEELHRQLTMSN
jgi:predicted transposase YdaD